MIYKVGVIINKYDIHNVAVIDSTQLILLNTHTVLFSYYIYSIL